MRALITLTFLLLSGIAFAQEPAAPPADATPAPTETPAVEAEQPTGPTIAPLRGIIANLNASYYSRELTDFVNVNGVPLADRSIDVLVLDLKLGYTLDFGLFVGAQVDSATGSVAGTDVKTFVVGPTVGYSDAYTGIFASATYHLFGNTDMGAAGKYDSVTGLQLDLAYPMQITEMVKFGPQLSYQRLKHTDGSAGLGDDYTSGLTPFFALWMQF